MLAKRLLITAVVSLGMASLIAYGFSRWKDSQIKPPPPSVEELPNAVVIYCMHDVKRGPVCKRIEELAHQAVEESFAKELDDGTLAWTLVNFEHPINAFVIDEYDVHKPTVVIVDGRQGMNRAWTNHQEKVWELLGDEKAFKEYISTEVKKALDATPPTPEEDDNTDGT